MTYLPGKRLSDNIDPEIFVPYSLVQWLLKTDTLLNNTSAFDCDTYNSNRAHWLLCGHLLRNADNYSSSRSGLDKMLIFEIKKKKKRKHAILNGINSKTLFEHSHYLY